MPVKVPERLYKQRFKLSGSFFSWEEKKQLLGRLNVLEKFVQNYVAVTLSVANCRLGENIFHQRK